MTQVELLAKMFRLTRLNDFIIIMSKEYNPVDWGYYYPDNKTIVIYTLDEDEEEIDEDSLIRIACHEVAHHIQHHYVEGYEVVNWHDDKFKEIFANLLDEYYNGEVPSETIEVIKEEGLYYEPNSQAKERLRSGIRSRRVIPKY